MMSKLASSRRGWKHGANGRSHQNHQNQPVYRPQISMQQHQPRRSKGKRLSDQEAKDKELERVMTAIQLFFGHNSENKFYENGASKADLCDHVMKQCHGFTVSKFRLALNTAIQLQLVQTVLMTHSDAKIKVCSFILFPSHSDWRTLQIPDDEFSGIPERISCWKSMDDELEYIADVAAHSKNNKEFHSNLKEIKCFFCSKLFYDLRGLRQHCTQSHYQAFGYLFKCPLCTHKFKKRAALDDHVHFNHSQE